MDNIDHLDDNLLKLLRKDARQSSGKLAQQLNVSPSTVRRRLGKLRDKGVLQVVAVGSRSQVASGVSALIALKVDLRKLKEVLRSLGVGRQCVWVATTTGRFDVLAHAWFHTSNRPEGQGSTGYARGGMRIRPKGVEQSSNPSECHGLCPWVSTELAAFIQEDLAKVEGIKETETFVCLSVEKSIYSKPDA